MAQIFEMTIALRIFGDTLVPDEISKILQCQPDDSYIKGQVVEFKSGNMHTKKTGGWFLKTDYKKLADFDEQIEKLFTRIAASAEDWKKITAEYEASIFSGLFMHESNEGFSISCETLKLLADRNIRLEFDIYDPVDEESI